MRRAVVLFSGGLDSAVILSLARWAYDDVVALNVYYQQRHTIEVQYARAFAERAGVPYQLVRVDGAPIWRGTAFLDGGLETGRDPIAIRAGGVSAAVLPGRNPVLLSYGIAKAATLGGGDVLFGATAEDAAGFPDCRPAFVAAMDALAQLVDPGVHVRAPLLDLTKRQVAGLAAAMAIDVTATWSCYRPVEAIAGVRPCGQCDACVLRADALAHPECPTDEGGTAAQQHATA